MTPTDIDTSTNRQKDVSSVPAWEWIAEFLATDSARVHNLVLAALAVLTVELAWAILAAGCPALNSMVWDVATLLDGGYRVMLGQRPHIDFYSPLGALPLLLLAGGIKMGGIASAYACVHAIMLVILVAWTWGLLRSRTSAVLAGVISFWVGVLAVAPRSLGFPPPVVTYSMQYNRWGWALLSIAIIELFLPRRDGIVRVRAGVSTGIVAGLLLFVKPNYLAAVMGAIVVRLLASRFDRKWASGLAGGFLAIAAAGFMYLRFNFGAFWGDLRLLGSVQTLSGRLGSIGQLTMANIPDLFFLGCAVLIAAPYARRAGASPGRVLRIAGPPVAVAAIGIVTCSANYQWLQIPLMYLAVFLLIEYVRRMKTGREWGAAAFLMLILIGAGATVGPFFEDLTTLLGAGSHETDPQVRDWPGFASAALADMRVEPRPQELSTESVLGGLRAGATRWSEQDGNAYPYVLWFNSGAALLRDRISARTHVLVMDLSNPFSFALGLTPPKGDALFWHYRRVFDRSHFPEASRVFRDVTDVMVPKTPIQRAATIELQQIYGSVLARDFQKAGENDLWIRYERRVHN